MASNLQADRISEIYRELTEDLVSVYRTEAETIALRTIDPRNVDRTQSIFLSQLLGKAKALSASYNQVSMNYIDVFSSAEGLSFPEASILAYSQPFNEQRFLKRMLGVSNYGYKHNLKMARASQQAPQAVIDKQFQQMIKNMTGDFANQTLSQGRDTVVAVSTTSPFYYGYSRSVKAGACKFCLMLATRNNYISRQTASFSAHRTCGCTPEPASDDWAPSTKQLRRVYNRDLARAKAEDRDFDAAKKKEQDEALKMAEGKPTAKTDKMTDEEMLESVSGEKK